MKKISLFRLLTQLVFLMLLILGVISIKNISLFIIISAIIIGPLFCGWLCFLGLYQDILRYIGKFFKLKEFELKSKVHSILKYSRYLFFLGSLTIGGIFLFPGKVWGSSLGLIKGYLNINTAFYCLILLGIISLFTERFFCRYFCTFGAKLGLYSLLRPITINRKGSCISCGSCKNKCLMNIDVGTTNSLTSPNCINCYKCIETCPNNSLVIGARNYFSLPK